MLQEQTSDVYVICTACSYCNLELAFLLDSSSKSIGDAWTQIKDYTSSVIARYNIHPSCIRVAVISYSDNAVLSIQLNRYNDRNSLQQAVRRLTLLNGGSNLANAFNMLRTQVFISNVLRPNTGLIAVVVTDQLQSSAQLTNEVNIVKRQGVTIIAVGITRQGRVDVNTLNAVSTNNNYAVTVSDYSQLGNVVNNVAQQWGCFPVTVPTTTTPGPAPRTFYFSVFQHLRKHRPSLALVSLVKIST